MSASTCDITCFIGGLVTREYENVCIMSQIVSVLDGACGNGETLWNAPRYQVPVRKELEGLFVT